MNALDTFRFPFLGAREDGEVFEYLLLDVNQEIAQIAIYKWMVNFTLLNISETVHLFIPNHLNTTYEFSNNISGTVSSMRREEDDQAHFYEIRLDTEKASVFVSQFNNLMTGFFSEFSLLQMLVKLIKDSLILKEGILIYLKHLAPYFSRIVNYSPSEYQVLEEFIFNDITNKIKKNTDSLNTLYDFVKVVKNLNDVPIVLNLEFLRENMESEINIDLFLFAFANLDTSDDFMALLKESKYQTKLKFDYYYINYLIAIKELENRLYSNYNKIVLIYMKCI